MKKETGGSAFPESGVLTVGNTTMHGQAGMTLRDYFAAKALLGAMTHEIMMNKMDFKDRAEWAYLQADAMIAAREAP